MNSESRRPGQSRGAVGRNELNVAELSIADADLVLEWVLRLLAELGEESDDLGALNRPKVLQDWREADDRFRVLVARTPSGELVGLLTMSESFAIYANGNYGVINEMIVDPLARSAGVGARLLDAAKDLGRSRGWSRIDVTAPESERWARSRRFYETQGFTYAGPKLKFQL